MSRGGRSVRASAEAQRIGRAAKWDPGLAAALASEASQTEHFGVVPTPGELAAT